MKAVLRRRAMVLTGATALGAVLLSSSCALAADQVAGGSPRPAVSRDGWGYAIRVPGMATLDTGDSAGVSSASCAAPGDCTVVGAYTISGFYHSEVYVISQVRGTWGKAVELPGLAALDKQRPAGVGSVSCASPGNCGTGGSYQDRQGHGQPFIASQVHGTWGKALEIPGLATLNARHDAAVNSISCPSPGNCVVVGSYKDSGRNTQAFGVSEVNGTWGGAEQVPGTAALNTGGYASASEISCASPGNCTAIGNYSDAAGFEYPFVISQVSGTWGTAEQIPGMAALNPQGAGAGYSVSCVAPGDCVAAGSEGVNNGFDVGGGGQPFVATQTNGTWGSASLVPAMLGGLNSGADGAVTSVSCASAGNCVAAGYYGVGKPDQKVYNLEVFVADEVNGIWGTAIEIPGTAGLNKNHWAFVGTLSCAARERCVVGGSYTAHSDVSQPFIDSRT